MLLLRVYPGNAHVMNFLGNEGGKLGKLQNFPLWSGKYY